MGKVEAIVPTFKGALGAAEVDVRGMEERGRSALATPS